MDAKTDARTLSFVVLSCLVHTALAVAVLTLNMQSERKHENVQIEILPTLGEQIQTPIVQEEKKAEIVAPKVADEEKEETVTALPPPPAPIMPAIATAPAPAAPVSVKPVAAAKPVLAKSLPATRNAVSQASRAETPVQQESPVALPIVKNENLEEISPEQHAELKDSDIASDLDEIDQQENAKVIAVNANLQKDADAEMSAQDAKLLALQKQNELDSQLLAQENAEKRAQERGALQASQKAKADQEASDRAAALAAAATAARNAKLAEEAQAAQAKKQGELASNQNHKFGGGSSAGDDVRSIEDLKQFPGNQRPQYDSEDRLRGRQGDVAFLAYVSKDGMLSQFKLLNSSGHRELDGKTLKAIRGWKFYPGQEGWVEIPYRWTLKGGAQPVGPILRTKRSASIFSSQPTSSQN